MLKIPIDDMVEKIKEKTGLSTDEINKKVSEKLEQLSGLVSKNGAVHIIANELGVKIAEQTTGRLKIKSVIAGMKSVETVGKVTVVYDVREFQKGDGVGKVGSFMIGDETGTIRVVAWGSASDKLKDFNSGDIVLIKNSYAKDNQGRREIHLGDSATLIINPDGVVVDEVNTEKPIAKRKEIKELSEEDNNVSILGTVVQVFDIRFYEVCPECSKRARPDGDVFKCEAHGSVTPNYSFVMNLFIDDGTDNIRGVCFRNQVEQILQRTTDEILAFKDDSSAFESAKNDLLGNIVLIQGRVVKNSMFDRLELVANDCNPKPDPEKEIENLQVNTKNDV